MDPPLVNEASFTAASNHSSYSLVDLPSLPMGRFGGGIGDASLEESTVTEQSGNGSLKRRRCSVGNSSDDVSTSNAVNHELNESNDKRAKASGSIDENGSLKTEAETNSWTSMKPLEESQKPEQPKDYIHVRARRGQATDSHSLAERARRERISERMKILQDLVPGCNKVIGKAIVLDEIINYIQSLQGQVEFLSMKLEAVNSRTNPSIEGFPRKDLAERTFDANQMIFGFQEPKENSQGTEWLHMQIASALERAT